MLRRFAVAVAFCCVAAVSTAQAEDWPMWRGPRGDGTVTEKNVPLHWGPDKNIVWRIDLPGVGHASPIIWGDSIFLTGANNDTQERWLMRLEQATGKTLWQTTVLTSPMEHKHKLNSYASSTPATDGKRVYVSFLDKDQMYIAAYDFAGKKLWDARPGVFSSVHGYCSSPVLWKDTVIVNGDHDGPGYVVALDAATGSVRWKVDRPNNTRSYCTPMIRNMMGRVQMVLSGTKCVTSYDPDTGKLLWIIDGPTEQYVASLVYNEKAQMLCMTCGFPQRHVMGIRPDGNGNVTNTHVAWHHNDVASYVSSPISCGDYFLVASDQNAHKGEVTCYEAKTGQVQWREKLGVMYSASLLTANGLVYALSDDGITTVIKPGPKLEVIATNDLGADTRKEKFIEGAMFSASPAVSDGQLFIRSQRHLWCIEEKHAN
jgi:hypothetical protein